MILTRSQKLIPPLRWSVFLKAACSSLYSALVSMLQSLLSSSSKLQPDFLCFLDSIQLLQINKLQLKQNLKKLIISAQVLLILAKRYFNKTSLISRKISFLFKELLIQIELLDQTQNCVIYHQNTILIYYSTLMGNVCVPREQEPLSCPHFNPPNINKSAIKTDFSKKGNSKQVCELCQTQQNYRISRQSQRLERKKTIMSISTQNYEVIVTKPTERQMRLNKSCKKTINDFEVLRGLGKGGFGKVYLIKERSQNNSILQENNLLNIDLQLQVFKQKEQEPQELHVEIFPSSHQFFSEQSQEGKEKSVHRMQSSLQTKKKKEVKKVETQKVVKDKYYALKIINKNNLRSNQEKQQALAERLILQSVNHPFIIKLHYAFQTSSRLFLIVDLLQGGELFYLLRKMGRFQEEVVIFYAAQILLALDYLHHNNIIYRDLKPENILLDSDGHIKITDFGLSKMLYSTAQKTYSFCGTPEYLAPQIATGKGYNKVADWFSFGSLLYDMLTGSPPFQSKNKREILNRLTTKSVYLPHYLSQNAKSLLKGLFKLEPSHRLGYNNGASQIMNHKFFEGVDFKKMFRKQITPPFKFDSQKMKSIEKEQLFLNSNGFQCWDSWQLNIDSPKKSRPCPQNSQHFQGFTYGIEYSLEGFNLEVSPQAAKK